MGGACLFTLHSLRRVIWHFYLEIVKNFLRLSHLYVHWTVYLFIPIFMDLFDMPCEIFFWSNKRALITEKAAIFSLNNAFKYIIFGFVFSFSILSSFWLFWRKLFTIQMRFHIVILERNIVEKFLITRWAYIFTIFVDKFNILWKADNFLKLLLVCVHDQL